MIPCEHILSHKRRHRAHRDGHVLFCIFTYSHFRPINTWSHEIHWICHRTKHFCGGRPHRLMQQQQKQRSGNVPRSNMAAPLTCFSLLMNVIHSVFENERIKTICYDTLVCVWGLSLQLWWGLDSCKQISSWSLQWRSSRWGTIFVFEKVWWLHSKGRWLETGHEVRKEKGWQMLVA